MSVQASHRGTKMLDQCSLDVRRGPGVLCRGGCWGGWQGPSPGSCPSPRCHEVEGPQGAVAWEGMQGVAAGSWLGQGGSRKSVCRAVFPAGAVCLRPQSACPADPHFQLGFLPRSLKSRILEAIPSLGPGELLPCVTPSRALGFAVVVHKFLRALPSPAAFPGLFLLLCSFSV